MPKTKPKNKQLKADHRGHIASLAVANVIMMTGASVAQNAAPATAPAAPATTAKPSAAAKPAAGTTTGKKAAPATNANAAAPGSGNLSEVVVTAKPEGSYQVERVQNLKYTEPLINIPATVVVVPKAVIQEQNAGNLREILANVPGITYNSGEGGAASGDNFNIRGFNARNDIFVDGFRDVGVYFRDSFNLEQVDVVKGPSSSYTGQGSTGGSVNLGTKTPTMNARYEATSGFGTEFYFRDTVDINQPLTGLVPNSAVRLNAFYQYDEQAKQDHVYNSRWGLFPTVALGLGTDSRATLTYLYQEEQNLPTYGVPTVSSDAIANINGLQKYNNTAAPYYNNFYGFADRDYEHTQVHIPTLKLEHDFSDSIKVVNTTRYSSVLRESVLTTTRWPVPLVPNVMQGQTQARHQYDTLVGNQLAATFLFDTWKLNHAVVTTMEYSGQSQDARTYSNQDATNGLQTSLSNPNTYRALNRTVAFGPEQHSELNTVSFSLFDTIKYNEQWILTGGMRFDNSYSRQSTDAGVSVAQTDDTVSWRLGLTYKPVPYGAFYFGYGNSFNPSIVTGNATNALTVANANLSPEENDSYEIGTKWDVLDQRLSLSLALFRTEKNNARVTDPNDPTQQILAGKQRVEGIELGVAGNITPDWQVFGGYSFTHSEVLDDPSAPLTVGNKLANTPEQTASLWTTYKLPYNFRVGTGFQFVDKRFAAQANTGYADAYVTQSLMVGYSVNKNVDVQLNVVNLWDEEYLQSIGSNNNIPGVGRNMTVTTRIRF